MSQNEAYSPNTQKTSITSTKCEISKCHTFDESQFKQEHANKIFAKYPTRYPILIWDLDNRIKIKRRKFIAPSDVTLGQFIYILRKQMIDFNPGDGLFLFIHGTNTLLPAGEDIGKVWARHNVNGFLKLTLARENTFG